jgi:hypothetical protein
MLRCEASSTLSWLTNSIYDSRPSFTCLSPLWYVPIYYSNTQGANYIITWHLNLKNTKNMWISKQPISSLSLALDVALWASSTLSWLTYKFYGICLRTLGCIGKELKMYKWQLRLPPDKQKWNLKHENQEVAWADQQSYINNL